MKAIGRRSTGETLVETSEKSFPGEGAYRRRRSGIQLGDERINDKD